MSKVPKYIEVRAKDNITADGTTVMVRGERYIIPWGWPGDKVGPNLISIVNTSIEDNWEPWDITKDLNGKKLLIQRAAGIGDMVFLSPVLKYIKDMYPTSFIGFACAYYYKNILRAIGNIDKIHQVPLPVSSLKGYDYHLSFMHSIESATGTEDDENCYDAMYRVIGVDPSTVPSEYKRPLLKDVSSSPKTCDKLIGIQPFSGSNIRDLPKPLVLSLIKELNARGCTVLIVCDPREHRVIELRNLTKDMKVVFTKETDIYNSCKDIKNCDWLITSDSSFAHIGPGLGIKTISIYGPFSARSRTLYYSNSWSIDTQPSCRCRLHTKGGCPHRVYPSPCMNISIDYVLNIVDMYSN